MENTKKITGEMLVGKICAEYPEAIPALQAVGWTRKRWLML